jgi:hypothetical protein
MNLHKEGGTAMILTYNLDRLHEQLRDAQRNHRFYNETLLQELDVLEKDTVITARIHQLYAENRLPPVVGPMPSKCVNCGKPLP